MSCGCRKDVCWGHRHLKALLGLENQLSRWLSLMAGKLVLGLGDRPQLFPSRLPLKGPWTMAAGLREIIRKNYVLFMTQPQESHSVTSSHSVHEKWVTKYSPYWSGREWHPIFQRIKCQRICRCICRHLLHHDIWPATWLVYWRPRIWILVLPLLSRDCVALGRSFHISESWFLTWQMGRLDVTHFALKSFSVYTKDP